MTQMNGQWWYERQGAQAGPVSFAVLQELAASGEVKPSTMVWTAGMPGWVRAETIPELDWPGSQVLAEGATPPAPAPALGAPPPFGRSPRSRPARLPKGGAARSAAEGVEDVGEINVTTTILLSAVTFSIYGVVKFFQTGTAYERLAGRETKFTTWFWIFVGTGAGAVVIGSMSDALLVPLAVAAVVFQFLTLSEALKARNEALRRWGLDASVTSDTTHYVLLGLGILLGAALIGIVLIVIQAVKWFQDWNAIRAAALRRPAAAVTA